MNPRTMRPLLIASAASLGALALMFTGGHAARAHVGVTSTTTEAGSQALLTFSIPHGCNDSATTKVSLHMPDGINTVIPTVNSNWTIEKVIENLATPQKDSKGAEITQRIAKVDYTAKAPLPADYRDTFTLSLRLPETAAGTTLYFPTIQTCEKGDNAWIEIPAAGQTSHDLKLPAPAISIIAPSNKNTHAQTTHTIDKAQGNTVNGVDQTPLVVSSLAVGVLGLIVGSIALLRTRTQQRTSQPNPPTSMTSTTE